MLIYFKIFNSVKLWQKENILIWSMKIEFLQEDNKDTSKTNFDLKDKSDSCALIFCLPNLCHTLQVMMREGTKLWLVDGQGWNCDKSGIEKLYCKIWDCDQTLLDFSLSGCDDLSVGNLKYLAAMAITKLWICTTMAMASKRTSAWQSWWMMAEGLARNKVINIKQDNYDDYGDHQCHLTKFDDDRWCYWLGESLSCYNLRRKRVNDLRMCFRLNLDILITF